MTIFDEITEFSNQLAKALEIDLTDPDVLTCFTEKQWHTSSYIIYTVRRSWSNWKANLEIFPKHDLDHSRYNNKFCDVNDVSQYIPDGWHYRFKGTTTENLPPKIHRDMILADLSCGQGRFVESMGEMEEYKVGDKIKLKKLGIHDRKITNALDSLPDMIATIRKIDKTSSPYGYIYYMEEILWPWGEREIEEIVEDEPIINRFEILDL